MRMELDTYIGSPDPDHDSDDNTPTSSDKIQSRSFSPSPQPNNRAQPDPGCIPDSVRGAPEELKPAIRKKQNKESARRSRRRRKELVMNLSQSIEMLVQKTQELESRLDSMERFLTKSGYEQFIQPRLRYPVISRGRSVPASDGGSDGGSRGGSQSGPGTGRGPGRSLSEIDDEDVERLIANCLGQL